MQGPLLLDHDVVLWLGDLNYRINLPEDAILPLLRARKLDLLMQFDQLTICKKAGGHFFNVSFLGFPFPLALHRSLFARRLVGMFLSFFKDIAPETRTMFFVVKQEQCFLFPALFLFSNAALLTICKKTGGIQMQDSWRQSFHSTSHLKSSRVRGRG